MDPFKIKTHDTEALHRNLAEFTRDHPIRSKIALQQANSSMSESGTGQLRSKKPLDLAFTALLLDAGDVGRLNTLASALHRMVERVLDSVIGNPELLARCFPHHKRIFPFLEKSAGSPFWQVVSRYDFVFSPDGQPMLLELNTGCPGGYFVTSRLIDPTREALANAGIQTDPETWLGLNTEAASIIETITALERQAGIEPGLVAVLNDENQLLFELDLLAQELATHGRDARIINAADLELVNGQLHHNGDRISSTYNKFRISIPGSPNHCWQEGFEERYHAFLTAQKNKTVVTVNGLCGMSIAEDKGLLGLLHDSEFTSMLDDAEKALVRDFIPWTSRLDHPAIGTAEDPGPLRKNILRNKDNFVIKPANEGRGFGVIIGRAVDQETWEAAFLPRPELPCIVQEFVESWSFPVSNIRDGELRTEKMFLTFAIAITSGKPSGFVSRVSSNLVTNVAQHGFGQAVFLPNGRDS